MSMSRERIEHNQHVRTRLAAGETQVRACTPPPITQGMLSAWESLPAQLEPSTQRPVFTVLYDLVKAERAGLPFSIPDRVFLNWAGGSVLEGITDPALRNPAFHLLWHVMELHLGRTPTHP